MYLEFQRLCGDHLVRIQSICAGRVSNIYGRAVRTARDANYDAVRFSTPSVLLTVKIVT